MDQDAILEGLAPSKICPICMFDFELDMSVVTNKKTRRVPIVSSKCGCTICYECVKNLHAQIVAAKSKSIKTVPCTTCNKKGAFHAAEPIINKSLCTVLEWIQKFPKSKEEIELEEMEAHVERINQGKGPRVPIKQDNNELFSTGNDSENNTRAVEGDNGQNDAFRTQEEREHGNDLIVHPGSLVGKREEEPTAAECETLSAGSSTTETRLTLLEEDNADLEDDRKMPAILEEKEEPVPFGVEPYDNDSSDDVVSVASPPKGRLPSRNGAQWQEEIAKSGSERQCQKNDDDNDSAGGASTCAMLAKANHTSDNAQASNKIKKKRKFSSYTTSPCVHFGKHLSVPEYARHSGWEGFNLHVSDSKLPDRFPCVLQLIDFFFPVKGNVTFYDALWIKACPTGTRLGIKTRTQLRKMKKCNIDGPLKWHRCKTEWAPPTLKDLVSFIEILKELPTAPEERASAL